MNMFFFFVITYTLDTRIEPFTNFSATWKWY